MILNSGNASGLRTCERRHAVEHADANRHFGRLGADRARPQTIAGERLEPVHQVLDQRALVIAAALLPFPSAVSRNGTDGLVAPGGAGRVPRPGHCPFARWDRRLCIARGNRHVALLRVVGAVSTDGIDRVVRRDLIEQPRQDLGIGDVLMRHQRSAYLAGLRIQREMYLAPRATLRIAVLAHLPFAFTVKLHPCAVDKQMQRLAVADRGQRDLQLLRATA